MMTRKTTSLALLLSVTFLTALGSVWIAYAETLRINLAGETREMSSAATTIRNTMARRAENNVASAMLIASLPGVRAVFRSGDRDRLFHVMEEIFANQRERFGIREGQFFTAPATNFVRLSAPTDAIGEDLSHIREMVVRTMETGEAQRGAEVGRRGLLIRGIAVVADEQGPIGAFELASDFKSVLADVRLATGYEVGVFVSERRLTNVATYLPQPDSERIIGGYRNVEATNWQVIRSLVTPAILLDAQGEYSTVLHRGTPRSMGLVVIPLRDYHNARIGTIVAARSFQNYGQQAQRALVNALTDAAFQSLIVAAIVMLLVNGTLLRPLAAIGTRLRFLAEGAPDEAIDDLMGLKDQIGDIARDAEALTRSMKPIDAATEGDPDAN